jgi:hypothetical protein
VPGVGDVGRRRGCGAVGVRLRHVEWMELGFEERMGDRRESKSHVTSYFT